MKRRPGLPPKEGLYDPANEHDACGMGFVANIAGQASHAVVRRGIEVLENLNHRGGAGCDPCTGDGAGVLIQVPDAFFRKETDRLGFGLPAAGAYAVGMVFLSSEPAERSWQIATVESVVAEEGQRLLGWREVPVDATKIGDVAREAMPCIRQVFIGAAPGLEGAAFERKLYVIRRVIENRVAKRGGAFHIPSMSSRTLVYKGLLLAHQIDGFYSELADPTLVSALALVHSRYSTNTFPSWELAHPYRYLCHNGEINTLRGNVNWMNARQGTLRSELFGDDLKKIFPVIRPGGSDSGQFDNALEFLILSGPQPAARHQHDDPRGLGAPRADGRRSARLLRVQLQPDRALGRARVDRVHRRHQDRRRARPQRPAALALHGDEGRLPGDGVGGRRARHAAGERRAQGPAAAGADLLRRSRAGPHHRRRGGQGGSRRTASLPHLGRDEPGEARAISRAPRSITTRIPRRASCASRSSATPARISAS